MTWEIVAGIIALVGFVASIGGMIWKLAALIAGIVTSAISVAAYVLGEASIDAAGAKKPDGGVE